MQIAEMLFVYVVLDADVRIAETTLSCGRRLVPLQFSLMPKLIRLLFL